MPVDVSEEEVNRTNKVLLADVGNSRTKLALVSGVSQGMPLLARQYELDSHNFNLRGIVDLSEKLSIDAKATYFTQEVTNRASTNGCSSSVISRNS